MTLLCYCPSESAAEGMVLEDGIRILRYHKLKLTSWHPGRLRAIASATAEACRTWLAARRFDVVHIHSPPQGLGVRQALGARPRYVYTAHSPMVLEQNSTWRVQGWAGRLKLLLGRGLLANLERRILQEASEIHTLSEFTRSALERDYGVGGRISVIPHWYTHRGPRLDKADARRILGWSQEARIFLTVRSMGPRYGLDIALRALGPLTQESECHFYLGGDGAMRPQLETLAAEFWRPSGKRIHFMGRITDEQLEMAYVAADLFILPTLTLECFGLIIVEALSFGCPVLGTDAGAIPEVLGPILPQFIVPAGDMAALQSRARQFLQGTLKVPERQALIDYAAGRYQEAEVISRFTALFEPSR